MHQAHSRQGTWSCAKTGLERRNLRHFAVEDGGTPVQKLPQRRKQGQKYICCAKSTHPFESLQQPFEADSIDPVQPALETASLPRTKPTGDVLLELKDVHKSFGSKRILKGTTMQVRRGQAIGIIGTHLFHSASIQPGTYYHNCSVNRFRSLFQCPVSHGHKYQCKGAPVCSEKHGDGMCMAGGSGTGKSTTLRLLAGLLAPDYGQVIVQGVPRRGLASDDSDAGK